MLTPEQAQMICDAHDIQSTLSNEEEVELLSENNPELLEAYRALVSIAELTESGQFGAGA